jgi:PST family polysaccharide transporter
LIESSDKKRLLSNFFSLASLQGVNYILPLLTFPYLVRVLGVEYFGLLAFATAVVTYFNIITDYGFNLTATREISIHRDDHKKVIEIFSSVMSIKLLLMFLSFFLLTILVFSFEKFSTHWEVYLLTFGTVVGQVLFPIWFFQGMERMKYITYLNIVAKVIFTVAIFVFVKEQNDFYLVPLFTSLGFIVVGLWSLWIIYKEFGIGFRLQPLETLKYYLLDGWDIFISRIFVSLYTTTNIIVLGLLTNNIVVGYYAIAEKIVNAVAGLFVPANQALYPYMVKVFERNKNDFLILLKKVIYIFLAIGLLLFFILFVFSSEIIILISKEDIYSIKSIYTILVFTIITNPFGPLFTQVLIIQKLNKEFRVIVKYTFWFNILLAPLMIYFYEAKGLAIVVVLSQVLVIGLCVNKILYVYKDRNGTR